METETIAVEEDTVNNEQDSFVVRGEVRGKRMVSGIQPSGSLHLGNYFGAMQQHIEGQRSNSCYFFVATYHAQTTVTDNSKLAGWARDVATDYLALGLDPARVALYNQTDVKGITDLYWILGCFTSFGDLERGVAFKDKAAKGLPANAGLFMYPVLMAADILITGADIVPVGEDQLQHIELARRIATRFNRRCNSEIFKIPQAKLNRAKTVPGLDGQKMSKSYGNTIPLFASKAQVESVVRGIQTNNLPVESPKNPDQCRAYGLLRALSTEDEAASWADQYRRGGVGYSEVKKRIVELYEAQFAAAREKRLEFERHPDLVDDILMDGAFKVSKITQPLMNKVFHAVGVSRRMFTWA